MKNRILLIITLGLALRLLSMSFFYHPDLKSQHFHGQFLSQGVVNIYQYISTYRTSLPYTDSFNYPPFIYYLLGTTSLISSLVVGPGLFDWLNDWGTFALSNSSIPLYLFWLKIPYLLADLLFLALLTKNISSKRIELISLLWSFNPISLYAIFMVGQFDILPALLTFVSYLLIKRQKLIWSVVAVSIAVAFKTYPIFLLPFILFRAKNLRQFSFGTLSCLLVFILWSLPFIKTPEFISSVFQSPLGQRLFVAGIDLGFGEKLPFFFILYSLLICFSWFQRARQDLLPEFLVVTSSILLLGHFHAQWAIWSLPFWLLFLSRFPKYLIIFIPVILVFFGTVLLLSDQYVFIGLFAPLNPQLLTIPPLSDLIAPKINISLLQSISHALLTGFLAFLLIISWRQYDDEKN